MKSVVVRQEDIYIGNLILVNPHYSYKDSSPTMTAVSDSEKYKNILMEITANNMFSKLMDKVDGYEDIISVSGWRSMDEQEDIYTQSLEENGEEFTRKYIALPCHSEHQTGLAIDVGLNQQTIDFICPDFPYTGICQDFRQNAPSYGFIERYPKNKELVTGISHEPWHFRYVGFPHATIMNKHSFALEEYICFLKQYPYDKKPYIHRSKNKETHISYIKADIDKPTQFEIEEDFPYMVSGNNVDGFIVTQWAGA